VKRVGTIAELRALLDAERAAGRSVGFVPTMGYLHEGHVSLMRAARSATDVVVTSIFVNPLQFAAHEDLDDYPRDLDRDCALAEGAGVDLVFVPSVDEMYPTPVPGGLLATTVSVAGVSEGMEGASRPTHFAGVATVVAKLFSIVGPCRAYFGEKDFQQLAVVRRMVADLSMPVEVVGCETVREDDGLAMSSRNAYLSPDERAAATVVHRALRAGAAVVLAGERDPAAVRAAMAAVVAGEPLGELDYVEVVRAADLSVPPTLDPAEVAGDLRLLAAVRFRSTRLIDNLGVTAPAAPTERS
jgi:pantoate--beta-alanine ligase